MAMHLIDYGHIRGGVLFHGTVSDMDGAPKSTWTYEERGRKVTKDQLIVQETFSFLWNGIADLGVFKRARVRDASRAIDPVGHHVIGIAFEDGPQRGRCLFLVPAGEADPEFAHWLEVLSVPCGDAETQH